MSVPKNRILWIDCLKGIAILLVVIGHNANETISRFFFCFHMPLFFILSGFLFSPKPYKQHLLKSAKRLLFPYVFYIILISLPSLGNILINKDLIGGGKLAFRLVYGGRFLMGEYGVFWFVTVLWCSQNLFNFLMQNKFREHWIPILLLVGYVSQLLPNVLPWNIQVVPIATVYLWIGYIIKLRLYPNLNRNKLKVLLPMSIVILAVVFLLRDVFTLDMKNNFFQCYGFSLVSSTMSCIAVAVISICISKINILNKVIGLLGMASMVIMYIHQPVKYILFTRIGMIENHIAVIISATIISLVVYLLFKRFTFTKRLV